MSHRPIEQKKRRRIAKALRRGRVPAFFDLTKWLIAKGYARSRKEARELILARKVKSDSHVVGVEKVRFKDEFGAIKEEDMVFEHLPVALRKGLTVVK